MFLMQKERGLLCFALFYFAFTNGNATVSGRLLNALALSYYFYQLVKVDVNDTDAVA